MLVLSLLSLVRRVSALAGLRYLKDNGAGAWVSKAESKTVHMPTIQGRGECCNSLKSKPKGVPKTRLGAGTYKRGAWAASSVIGKGEVSCKRRRMMGEGGACAYNE